MSNPLPAPEFKKGNRCPCGADILFAPGIGPFCARTGADEPCPPPTSQPFIIDPVGKDTGASLNSQLRDDAEIGNLRFCNCTDPENCTTPIPGYVCRPRAPLPASEPPTTSIVMTNCRFYDKDGREQSGEEVRRSLQAWGIFVDPAENRVCRTCRFLSAPHTYAEGLAATEGLHLSRGRGE